MGETKLQIDETIPVLPIILKGVAEAIVMRSPP
jgi:hypothetical protein